MISSIVKLLLPFAIAYPCPETLKDHGKAQQALQWLQTHAGSQILGECQIEITHCNPEEASTARSTLGEVLMIDQEGREFYFNLRLPAPSVRKVETKFKLNPYSFWVRQKNKYFEVENGRTEVWRFEMQSQWGDPSTIKRIEMGVYTTNSQLNHWWSGNDSHWMVCE